MNSAQTECDSHARYVDDSGHETVVVCDEDRHSTPVDDSRVVHHDPRLGIYWLYDDEEVRFDDDEGARRAT